MHAWHIVVTHNLEYRCFTLTFSSVKIKSLNFYNQFHQFISKKRINTLNF